MTGRNMLFIVISIILLVFVPIMPELVYLLIRNRGSRQRFIAVLSLFLLLLGIVAGVLVYFLVE